MAQWATLSLLRTLSTESMPVTAVGIACMIRDKDFGSMPETVEDRRVAELASTLAES